MNALPELAFSKLYPKEEYRKAPTHGGIYLIFGKNTLLYVGQTNNFQRRLYQHFCSPRDMEQYVSHNYTGFKFSESLENKDAKEMYETYYINLLKPCFNVSKVFTYQTDKYNPKWYTEEFLEMFGDQLSKLRGEIQQVQRIDEPEDQIKKRITSDFIKRIQPKDISFGGTENCSSYEIMDYYMENLTEKEKSYINKGAISCFFGTAKRIVYLKCRQLGYPHCTARRFSGINPISALNVTGKTESQIISEFTDKYHGYSVDFNDILNIQ